MKVKTIGMVIAIGFCLLIFRPVISGAHCDTLAGPVVKAAKIALEKGDITPVLKWVKKEQEKKIQAAFKKTLSVRTKGPEAKELADMYFFETLVRLHRTGEGASYTGLKPAGSLDPVVAAADKALESGSADGLTKMVSNEVASGINKHFSHALEKKKYANESVEAGREFVEAYVMFVHYVERLYQDTQGLAGHHMEANEHEHKCPSHAE
jgi:hypothetical protein